MQSMIRYAFMILSIILPTHTSSALWYNVVTTCLPGSSVYLIIGIIKNVRKNETSRLWKSFHHNIVPEVLEHAKFIVKNHECIACLIIDRVTLPSFIPALLPNDEGNK